MASRLRGMTCDDLRDGAERVCILKVGNGSVAIDRFRRQISSRLNEIIQDVYFIRRLVRSISARISHRQENEQVSWRMAIALPLGFYWQTIHEPAPQR